MRRSRGGNNRRGVIGGMMPPPVSRRGRRPILAAEAMLERIRRLGRRERGLFRAHLEHGALYARARRRFGSWARALEAAGIDYRATVERARARAAAKRRRRPRVASRTVPATLFTSR